MQKYSEISSSEPTTNDISARYQCAQSLMQEAYGAKQLVQNDTLIPHWIDEGNSFWYVQDSAAGKRFQRVDIQAKTQTEAFDHQALAVFLSSVGETAVDADKLPLADLQITAEPTTQQLTLQFTAFNRRWHYKPEAGQGKEQEYPSPDWQLSPDGRTAAFVRDHNLWLKELDSGEERALTQDGQPYYVYASAPTIVCHAPYPITDLLWSPDSRTLLTQVIDTRKVRKGIPLVQHVPSNGSLTPTILEEDRRVGWCGDDQAEAWQLLAIDVVSGAITAADLSPVAMTYPPYEGYFRSGRAWWDKSRHCAYIVDQQSDRTCTRVLRWHIGSGKTDVVFAEDPALWTILMPKTHARPLLVPLPENNELIWYSERDGWAHLYLYDLESGELKYPLTQGEWLVRSIVHIDTERRELWLQTAGRNQGHNPYYPDICRLNLDTGELTPVVDGEDSYFVRDESPEACMSNYGISNVSPDGEYVITTKSRVDTLPESIVLDRDGKFVMTLVNASFAMPYVQLPVPVKTRSADGESDIYGILYRPSDFDANKRYPILDYSFLSYAEPTSAFGWLNLEAMAYAELGFVVVKFFHRTTLGLRSRHFRERVDHNKPFYDMSDNAAGIQQLAKRYDFLDATRVGGAIHSSLPTGLGTLSHPETYHVGVSVNCMTDARIIGLGIEEGGDDFPHYEQFAENLTGKLLLIAGMLDDSCPATGTFRLAEALKKANKRFDMLVLPNLGHEMSDYVTQRAWDYLVEHLLGVEPPKNFVLNAFAVPR